MEKELEVVDEFFAPKFQCEYQDEIICPHCGYKHSDSWEMAPDDECGTATCSDCGKDFSITVNRSVSYSSSCGDSWKDCELVSQPSEAHPDYLICKKCGRVEFKRFLKEN